MINPAIIGRNRPCPCGSGKKRKYCHPDLEVVEGAAAPSAPTSSWKYVILAVVALGGISLAAFQLSKPPAPLVVPQGAPSSPALGSSAIVPPLPASGSNLTPPPPGPAPAGKVWSPEHGHWHDAATGSAMTMTSTSTPIPTPTISGVPGTLTPIPAPTGATPTPGQLTPQPPGETPPGKVWSPEHGHWHDLPGATPSPTPVATPAPGAQPSPTPAEAPTLTPISEPTEILGSSPQSTPPTPAPAPTPTPGPQ